MIASREGYLDVVESLIGAGADVDLQEGVKCYSSSDWFIIVFTSCSAIVLQGKLIVLHRFVESWRALKLQSSFVLKRLWAFDGCRHPLAFSSNFKLVKCFLNRLSFDPLMTVREKVLLLR